MEKEKPVLRNKSIGTKVSEEEPAFARLMSPARASQESQGPRFQS